MGKSKKIIGVLCGLLVLIAAARYLSRHQSAPEESNRSAGSICILQYVDHPLLNSVYKGFRDEFVALGHSSELIEFSNAHGDAVASALLAERACQGNCAIIFALGTPIAQSAKTKCSDSQSILFGAITDPVSAGLVNSRESTGGNATGTSDQWPYKLQMQLIAQVWGSNATVGIPFNPAEANTQFAMEQVRREANGIGLQLEEVPISSGTEAGQSVDAFSRAVSVIYIPADNTAVAAAPGIISAANRLQLPVVAGDPGTFEAGAVVGLGVNYEDLGVLNARQADAILGGLNPAQIPVEVSGRAALFLDEELARRYSIDPQEVRAWYQQAIMEK